MEKCKMCVSRTYDMILFVTNYLVTYTRDTGTHAGLHLYCPLWPGFKLEYFHKF
jgi:hypothetical protein